MRNNFVEGLNVLQADPAVDQSGLSDELALTLRSCARRLLSRHDLGLEASHSTDQTVIDMIVRMVAESRSVRSMTKSTLLPAFDPIARSQKAVLGIPKGPQISAFDGPISVITEDLAPYVRSIVSYDLRLEEQRRQLSSLLSHPGMDGKRMRTTRASRAALEGGNKACTRRERWFPKQTNFDAVLQSGGKGWQDTVLQRAKTGTISEDGLGSDGSRRSSLGSAMGSDA